MQRGRTLYRQLEDVYFVDISLISLKIMPTVVETLCEYLLVCWVVLFVNHYIIIGGKNFLN